MLTSAKAEDYVRSRRRLRRWGVGIVAVAGAILLAVAASSRETPSNTAPTAFARRGPMVISVSDSGTIRPREQVILKNELEDPATILSIVPEGTMVKKGGVIVELDVSASRKALVERRIRVQSAEASVVFASENYKIAESQGQADIEQAELTHRFALADLDQYLKGQYPRSLKQAEAAITIAEEERTRAQEHLNWSNVLFGEKYLSRTALQQDELALQKADLAVELAKADLDLMKTHTHPRQMATYESNVKQTEMSVERTRRKVTASMAQASADLNAKKALFEEEKAELEELEDQVSKGRITAPVDGMVLYASSLSDDWDDDDPRIEIGATIDERGEIVYLPTTASYNVDVKILEVNLRKVRIGQEARILVDAMPGRVFTGKVTNISPVPDAASRFLNPNLKLYNTAIEIESTDPALRSGMSSRVEIFVEQYPDAVYVPIQSVTRVRGQAQVHLIQNGQAIAHPVEIGLDNGRFIHVTSGLSDGQEVLLAPPLFEEERSEDLADDETSPPSEKKSPSDSAKQPSPAGDGAAANR